MLSILDKRLWPIFFVMLGFLFFSPLYIFAQTSDTSGGDLVQFLMPSQEMTIKVGEPLTIQYKTLEGADIAEVRHSVSGEFNATTFASFIGKPGLNSFLWTPTLPGRYQVAVNVYQRRTHSTQWSNYITVNPSSTAPSIDFTTSKVLFTKKGEQGVLSWRAKNATQCMFFTGFTKKRKVSLVGSQKIKPKDNTRYSIECTNGNESGDGTRSARKTIEVSIWHSTARLIDTFAIKNFTGMPNTTALFTWKAAEASTCDLYRVSEEGSLAGLTETSNLGPQGSVVSVITQAASAYPTQYALLCEQTTGVGENQTRRFQDIRVRTYR